MRKKFFHSFLLAAGQAAGMKLLSLLLCLLIETAAAVKVHKFKKRTQNVKKRGCNLARLINCKRVADKMCRVTR